MSRKHKKTLQLIFKRPVQSGVPWKDIMSLFRYLGATIEEGNGSRVRIMLENEDAVFHRPHPRKKQTKVH